MSDETYAALKNMAVARKQTIAELLAAVLKDDRPAKDGDGLLPFLNSDEFRAIADPTERYLSLLAWCAVNHASDFSDFISHQESGHGYLTLNRDEIREVLAHNHARQIDGTQVWAVMAIDEKTRGASSLDASNSSTAAARRCRRPVSAWASNGGFCSAWSEQDLRKR